MSRRSMTCGGSQRVSRVGAWLSAPFPRQAPSPLRAGPGASLPPASALLRASLSRSAESCLSIPALSHTCSREGLAGSRRARSPLPPLGRPPQNAFRRKRPDQVLPDSLTCVRVRLLRASDVWRNTPELERSGGNPAGKCARTARPPAPVASAQSLESRWPTEQVPEMRPGPLKV